MKTLHLRIVAMFMLVIPAFLLTSKSKEPVDKSYKPEYMKEDSNYNAFCWYSF
jgi:hypothetical protein